MRIGTRGSALALAQATWVAERLDPPAELVTVMTSGDRRRAVDDKREWVLELEEALVRGDVDLAVHSAKDVPVERPDTVATLAAPPRASAGDVLCGAGSLDELARGARVGTSSLRRAAQLRARRPDLEVVELRGNVDTRLRKLADGEVDAIILAAAGLERLGREAEVGTVLDFVPAAGQGTLMIEGRAGDVASAEAVAHLRNADAEAALAAERAVVAALGADCRSAVGVHAVPRTRLPAATASARPPDGAASAPPLPEGDSSSRRLHLRAFVGAVDGSAWLTDELDGDDPSALGAAVAERLLAVGAAELLR
ncbi:MAG TPA: hydroxymethylbilane synthase [Solirubrobacteraceae bacterium]